MEKIILVVNSGSASKKYALYKADREILYVQYEKQSDLSLLVRADKREDRDAISENDFRNSLSHFINLATKRGVISSANDISAVGIRVVAPGSYFVEHRKIDGIFLSKLHHALTVSPLHLEPILDELEKIKKILPNAHLVSASDSHFHATMNAYSRVYGIAREDTGEMDIQRYGYHGLSAESVVRSYKKRGERFPNRAVICHMGGGTSISGLIRGKTADTSMGFTPTEGVIGGSRVGEIDAQAVLELQHKYGNGLREYLNKKCGLLGLSGLSNEILDLLNAEKSGHMMASAALHVYVRQIQKYIGAMVAVIGGLDALIFTGTAGERSGVLRKRICGNMGWLGVYLDDKQNDFCYGKTMEIGRPGSKVSVMVVKTDEMGAIAKIAKSFS